MAQENLLGHTLEKFGMVTVLDARFYDPECGDVLIEFDTLTVSNISAEGQQKEIRGGQGADLLLSYDYGRTANIEITDALASMYSLEYLWGGKLKNDNIVFPERKEYIITGNTLPAAPVAEPGKATVAYYGKDANGKDAAVKQVITVGGETLLTFAKPEEITTLNKIVAFFNKKATAGAHVHELVLTATDFPPVVRFVGETFLIDQTSGKKIPMQIEIPRFKINSNFTFSLEAEGDASVFDFSGVALSDNGNLMYIRTLGEGVNEETEACVTKAVYDI